MTRAARRTAYTDGMRVLRVYVSAGPHRGEWALFDASGHAVEQGAGPRPPCDAVEAVIDADAVRIIALRLPPMPRSRVATAAAYALEDRVATPDQVAIGVGPQRADHSVLAVLAARELVAPLAAAHPPIRRAIAEPELAAPVDGWRWCETDHAGFVRTSDGAAFAVSRSSGVDLPPELAHALAQAAREGHAPTRVVVDRVADPTMLADWSRSSGVAFVAGDPWRWRNAPESAFTSAIDLLGGLRVDDEAARPRPRTTPAWTMLAAAGVLHVAGTLATWGWTHVRLANLERDLVPIAQAAGASSATPQTAAADIQRLHANARHRAGLAAADDALPVLARAAPALAALPAGVVRSAVWNAGGWTVELAPVDEGIVAPFIDRLAGAGLTPLHARTAAGVRARISP